MIKEGKIKTILVSQNKPEAGKKTIFDELITKFKVKIDYRSFIQVEPVHGRDVRKSRVSIISHSAVIFNSKNAVDHFFRVVEEMRVDLPQDMKYFCTNEGIGLYIQKYIFLRKRKVFTPKGITEKDFFSLLTLHKTENFLFPCSDIRKSNILDFCAESNISIVESTMYKTVSADLSNLENVFYDAIVFFSPADVKSLFENFPEFKQNNTRLVAIGETTQAAMREYNLFVDIPAPTKENPSIFAAIESYIKISNG